MAKIIMLGSRIPINAKKHFMQLGHTTFHATDDIIEKQMDDISDMIMQSKADLLICYPPCNIILRTHVPEFDKEALHKQINNACTLYNAPTQRICFINPRSQATNTIFREPDQIIDPEYLGELSVQMRHLVWLKNLPLIKINNRAKEDIFELMAKQWDHLLYKPTQSTLL